MTNQDTFNFEIAGVVFAIRLAEGNGKLKLPDSYNSFLTSSPPEYCISVNLQQLQPISFSNEQKVFDSQGSWCLFRTGNQYHIIIGDSASGSQPDRIAILEDGSKRIQIFCNPHDIDENASFNPLEYPLDQILMICLLTLDQGLLVHACGFDDDGKGYLFAGNSTDGKSSLTKLWQNHARILNDDRIIVRRKNGRFFIFGTPWHGDFRDVSPDGVLLERIFFLHKGKTNEIKKRTGAATVSSLLTRSFTPLWDPTGMGSSTDFCASMLESVPCYDLSFTLDEKIVNFIRCAN